MVVTVTVTVVVTVTVTVAVAVAERYIDGRRCHGWCCGWHCDADSG